MLAASYELHKFYYDAKEVLGRLQVSYKIFVPTVFKRWIELQRKQWGDKIGKKQEQPVETRHT